MHLVYPWRESSSDLPQNVRLLYEKSDVKYRWFLFRAEYKAHIQHLPLFNVHRETHFAYVTKSDGMTENDDRKAFFYGAYLMGYNNGIIEPIEGVNPPNLMDELPADKRRLVESLRDMEIEWESPPENVELFFKTARDVVSGSYVD